jgi:nitroreductase
MRDILGIIRERHSARVHFDRERPVTQQDLSQILEAGRWAPTAHNMQNFQVIVVDGAERLEAIANVESRVSDTFIRENYQQLSFSREELLRKKVGLLSTMFPPSWTNPGAKPGASGDLGTTRSLRSVIQGSPVLLIVIYDTRARAPASEGDVLGIMSLGCVMENMWLMAESLGIGFQVMSMFSADPAESEVKRLLRIPAQMKIAFACRLGYPTSAPGEYPRVRREVEDFVHHDAFGNKGAER